MGVRLWRLLPLTLTMTMTRLLGGGGGGGHAVKPRSKRDCIV